MLASDGNLTHILVVRCHILVDVFHEYMLIKLPYDRDHDNPFKDSIVLLPQTFILGLFPIKSLKGPKRKECPDAHIYCNFEMLNPYDISTVTIKNKMNIFQNPIEKS